MKGVIVGQAATDLPDTEPATASKASESGLPAGPDSSADDLLSKIAGDEIDRLLADAERTPAAVSVDGLLPTDYDPLDPPVSDADDLIPSDAAGAGTTRTVPGVEQEIDAILGSPAEIGLPDQPHIIDEPRGIAPEAQKPVPDEPDGMQAQLDAILNDLSTDHPTVVTRPEIADAPNAYRAAASDESVAAGALNEGILTHGLSPRPHAASEPADVVRAAAERAALTEPIELDGSLEPPDAPLPAYLKPLEILNSPLASMPEWFTETLGKVAVITAINAISVIVYVIVFRSPRS